MAKNFPSGAQIQSQSQQQKQIQKLSQNQIQAITFLAMDSLDLRDEINKAVSENPALKIVNHGKKTGDEKIISRGNYSSERADSFQQTMEATETYGESLQEHLLHQINAMNISADEHALSAKLIYNLDSDGFYGSNLAPEFLLDKARPQQTRKMLQVCMDRIQRLDPVGTCCRNWEESLYVQAKINGDADVLTMFLLNGHLDLLEAAEPGLIVRKIESFRSAWHKKAFAAPLEIDGITLNKDTIYNALQYIRTLNPHPAQGYDSDTMSSFSRPDVVVSVEKVPGKVFQNDYNRGVVCGDETCHFQIKYACGDLPEVRVDETFFDKNSVRLAQNFVNNLMFRESTIVLQACAIVNAQHAFFLDGKSPLTALTRRQLAKELNVHESTISRTSNKKNSKFFQTPWGLYPASYFFCSSVNSTIGTQKISSSEIKSKIKVLSQSNLSDQQITEKLNSSGIKISRRTVNKYRTQMGVGNSFERSNE